MWYGKQQLEKDTTGPLSNIIISAFSSNLLALAAADAPPATPPTTSILLLIVIPPVLIVFFFTFFKCEIYNNISELSLPNPLSHVNTKINIFLQF
jgi:hypothetical protein